MTLDELSKAIGRSKYSISRWENERAIPRNSTRRLLIEWLRFDPEAVSHCPKEARKFQNAEAV
jgi:transcriptional regulator with XRE-family HTH domain